MSTSFARTAGIAQDVPPIGEAVVAQLRDHAIFIIDPAGRIASWNSGVQQVFGYEAGDWIGQPAHLIFRPEDVESRVPERELEAATSTGRASDDRWLVRRDGERIFGVCTVSRLDADDGGLVGFAKVVCDHTAFRRSEEERAQLLDQESTARAMAAREAAALTAAIDAIPEGVFIGGADGIERCNASGLALFGATSLQDLQGPLTAFRDRFHVRHQRDGEPIDADDLPFARALYGEVTCLQYWIRTLTGHDVCLRTTAAPIVVDGATVGAIAVHADMTEQVRREHRRRELDRVQTILRARDQELRALVEGVREYAIFTVDTEARISSWHAGAELMKGYTAEEAIGMPFANLFTEDDRQRGQPEREMRIAAETGAYQGEGHRLRKNGEIFEAAVVLTALRDASGGVLGYLKLTQDISARRQQEHDQRQALQDAETARASAERVSRSMGEFLATISHELRTPLSAILGWAAVLSRSASASSEAKRGLDAITRNARIQISLIEDLLDMNRIEAGQLRLDIQPVEPTAVILGAMESVQPAVRAKGLRLRTELDPIDVGMLGDSARLQQVIWNLLMNAVKFTPRGGTIRVGLRHVGDQLEFAVADTGQGIEAAFLPHLFERFRQQDATTTRRHGGLGLGLAIVKQLTELHGGSVRVESPGSEQGSTFTVSIPVADDGERGNRSDPDTRPVRPVVEAGKPLPRLDGTRVLLVDDEADVRDVAAMVLRGSGADVTLAGNARDALTSFVAEPPDVLVSDIGLPEHDGYELLRWIRAMRPEQGGRTPVIAFTAYAMADDRRRVRDAGFDGHLVKPVEPDVLVEAVHALAGTRSGEG